MFDHGVGIEGMSLRKSFGEGDALGSEVFIVLRGGRGACLRGFSTPYQALYYPASALPHPKSTSGRIEEGGGRLNRAPMNTEGPPPCQLFTAVDPSSSAWRLQPHFEITCLPDQFHSIMRCLRASIL